MAWITDTFGTYSDFLDYFEDVEPEYIVIITYDSTDTILTIESGNIINLGLLYERHEVYETLFTSMSLKVQFPLKSGGGGAILYTAYENEGIKAEASVQIRKHNPATNDYDVFYDGIVDFSDKSFRKERDIVECNLIDNSSTNRFLARDETSVNIRSNKSLDGGTITDISTDDILFKAIDIYLDGTEQNGEIFISKSYSGISTDEIPYVGGSNKTDRTSGRIDFGIDVFSDGIIYNNSQTSAAEIKYVIECDYNIDCDANIGEYINNVVMVDTLTSLDVVINSQEIFRFDNAGDGNKFVDSSFTYESTYLTMPIDGKVRFYLKIEYSGGVETTTTINPSYFQLIEKNPSFGDTTVDCYKIGQAMDKVCRMISGSDCSLNILAFNNDYIVGGGKLRGYPAGDAYVTFRDMYKTVKALRNCCLYYSPINDTFVIIEREDIFPDIELLDLGPATNVKITPGDHYGTIKSGWASDGKYEQQQGANEYNIQTTHSMPIPIKKTLDIQAPLYGDSIYIELTRRQQYSDVGLLDTSADDKTFFIETSGGTTVLSSTINMTGFLGIESFYNPSYIPRRNLLRHGNYIMGNLYKIPADNISFSTAKKDLSDIEYTIGVDTISEVSDIEQSEVSEILYYPEQHEFEVAATQDLIDALNTQALGYFTYQDEDLVEHHIYIDKAQLSDFNRKFIITGRKANINR